MTNLKSKQKKTTQNIYRVCMRFFRCSVVIVVNQNQSKYLVACACGMWSLILAIAKVKPIIHWLNSESLRQIDSWKLNFDFFLSDF